jgi:aminopeptidase C
MRWEEIKNAFKDQWVLVKVDRVDASLNIVEGEVLAHSKDKDEVYKKLLQIRPKEFSIEYTGVIPEDLAVVLVNVNENI